MGKTCFKNCSVVANSTLFTSKAGIVAQGNIEVVNGQNF